MVSLTDTKPKPKPKRQLLPVTVQPLADGTYRVSSASVPGKHYIWDEVLELCSCPDWTYGGIERAGRGLYPLGNPFRRCRHGVTVRDYILSAPDEMRQPTPATLARVATAHLEACAASGRCTACGSVAAAGSPYCAFCQPGVLSQGVAS